MSSCLNFYDIGDRANVSVVFTNPNTGSPVDPADVYLDFADPDGNSTTWQYGADPQITRSGVGSYEALIELDKAGYWWYSWRSTGTSAVGVEQDRFFVRDTVIPPAVPGYSTKDDLYNIYGRHNVDKWADLNNDNTEADIINRINWAISRADAEINSRLHNGPWDLPFSAPIDPIIIDLSARYAGVLLYESRGITDANTAANHELLVHRNMFEKQIRELLAGQRGLSTVNRNYTHWPENILSD